jgi:hypothetical protein
MENDMNERRPAAHDAGVGSSSDREGPCPVIVKSAKYSKVSRQSVKFDKCRSYAPPRKMATVVEKSAVAKRATVLNPRFDGMLCQRSRS